VQSDQYPNWLKRPTDGAGDGFVTSIRGLFNTQRRKAKAFVLRTMRGEAENDFHGEWSESDAEFSPFARQLTITKAKRLIKRHTKKFRSRGQKGLPDFFSMDFVLNVETLIVHLKRILDVISNPTLSHKKKRKIRNVSWYSKRKFMVLCYCYDRPLIFVVYALLYSISAHGYTLFLC